MLGCIQLWTGFCACVSVTELSSDRANFSLWRESLPKTNTYTHSFHITLLCSYNSIQSVSLTRDRKKKKKGNNTPAPNKSQTPESISKPSLHLWTTEVRKNRALVPAAAKAVWCMLHQKRWSFHSFWLLMEKDVPGLWYNLHTDYGEL